RQASQGLHRNLERTGLVNRRLIEHAGRYLNVLALQGQHNVICGEAQRLQSIRIEPGAHRIVAAAEHDQRADPINARDGVGDLDGGVVGNEQGIARFVRRVKVHDHHQVGRALVYLHADIAHIHWQAGLGNCDTILTLHLGDIGVVADVEGPVDRKTAVAGRIRRYVDHVLDAVDLLLDRRDYVAATTSALAPGYWPVTVMVGGAISGYWATGSR